MNTLKKNSLQSQKGIVDEFVSTTHRQTNATIIKNTEFQFGAHFIARQKNHIFYLVLAQTRVR